MDEELTEVLREAGLPDDGFADVLQALAVARAAPLPQLEPPPELVALWSGSVAATPRRGRRTAMLVAALLGGLGAGTAAAAAANTLPEPVQEVVADFSDSFLPFHFPHPTSGDEQDSPRFEVPDEPPVLSPTAPAAPGTTDTSHPHDPSPAGPSPAGAPPVSEPPVGAPPVGAPPVGAPPVSEPPVAEPPAGAPPVGAPPVSEPPVSEPPVGAPDGAPTSGADRVPDTAPQPVPQRAPHQQQVPTQRP